MYSQLFLTISFKKATLPYHISGPTNRSKEVYPYHKIQFFFSFCIPYQTAIGNTSKICFSPREEPKEPCLFRIYELNLYLKLQSELTYLDVQLVTKLRQLRQPRYRASLSTRFINQDYLIVIYLIVQSNSYISAAPYISQSSMSCILVMQLVHSLDL